MGFGNVGGFGGAGCDGGLVGGFGGGFGAGGILVLFILLVIISRGCFF